MKNQKTAETNSHRIIGGCHHTFWRSLGNKEEGHRWRCEIQREMKVYLWRWGAEMIRLITIIVLLSAPAMADSINIGEPVTVDFNHTAENSWYNSRNNECQVTEIC